MIGAGIKLMRLGSSLMLIKASLHNPVLLRQLEMSINNLIRQRPQAMLPLAQLQGKKININVKGLNLRWHMVFVQQQVLLNAQHFDVAQATLEFDLKALGYFLNTHLSPKGAHPLTLDGDIQTMLALRNLSDALQLEVIPTLKSILGRQLSTAMSAVGL